MKNIIRAAAICAFGMFLAASWARAEDELKTQDRLQTREQLRTGNGEQEMERQRLKKGEAREEAKMTGLDRADEAAGEHGKQGRERAREMSGGDKAKGGAIRENVRNSGEEQGLKDQERSRSRDRKGALDQERKEERKQLRRQERSSDRRAARSERRQENRASGGNMSGGGRRR